MIVHELSGWDPEAERRVMDWPLRDLLQAHLAKLKAQVQDAHRFETLLWALLAPHRKKPGQPPALPPLLHG